MLGKSGWFVLPEKAPHFQVQQQLFTLTDRKHCDFVVCAISPDGEPQIVKGELWYKNKYFSKERPNIIVTNFPILVALSCKLTSYCAIEVGLKCD